jgi:hypothetical protein
MPACLPEPPWQQGEADRLAAITLGLAPLAACIKLGIKLDGITLGLAPLKARACQ